MSARLASSRCGASKNTIVRSSVAKDSKRRRRSPALRGKNPSNANRATGKPDNTSAASAAEGPGNVVIATPASCASRTNRKPGSLTEGIPASVTTSTCAPERARSINSGTRADSLPS